MACLIPPQPKSTAASAGAIHILHIKQPMPCIKLLMTPAEGEGNMVGHQALAIQGHLYYFFDS